MNVFSQYPLASPLTSKKWLVMPLLLSAGLITGCSNLGVKPWERDLLAKPEMALVSSPVEAGLDDHIYFSKEATSGGRSFAGGGCGCN